MFPRANRRRFLKTTAAAGFGFWVAGNDARAESASPNEKLNLGIIGAGGRGAANLAGVSGENIVALCDVDDLRAAEAYLQFPQAKRYADFRKMLEAEPTLNAVVVSTADHTHAAASVMAMKLGKHVYCEKPLSHSVFEARVVAQTAAQAKVATQMGTQIHAEENYRRVVEVIQSGAVGPVQEVHVWVSKNWGGGERPAEAPQAPESLQWDLWLGPASERPYHPTYLPANWRRWWDFGNGTLGDMGCHYMDLPFWALGLRHPTAIAAEGPPVHPETTPLGLIVRYEFPARDAQPPVRLSWYDGQLCPKQLNGLAMPESGVLFVGDKGMLLADYGYYKLLPEGDFAGYQPPPPSIAPSIGHHQEWIAACKTGSPTTCAFDAAGALTEAVLLGNVAFRVGKKLDWNAEQLTVTNCPEAASLLRREYRAGWTL